MWYNKKKKEKGQKNEGWAKNNLFSYGKRTM